MPLRIHHRVNHLVVKKTTLRSEERFHLNPRCSACERGPAVGRSRDVRHNADDLGGWVWSSTVEWVEQREQLWPARRESSRREGETRRSTAPDTGWPGVDARQSPGDQTGARRTASAALWQWTAGEGRVAIIYGHAAMISVTSEKVLSFCHVNCLWLLFKCVFDADEINLESVLIFVFIMFIYVYF